MRERAFSSDVSVRTMCECLCVCERVSVKKKNFFFVSVRDSIEVTYVCSYNDECLCV